MSAVLLALAVVTADPLVTMDDLVECQIWTEQCETNAARWRERYYIAAEDNQYLRGRVVRLEDAIERAYIEAQAHRDRSLSPLEIAGLVGGSAAAGALVGVLLTLLAKKD